VEIKSKFKRNSSRVLIAVLSTSIWLAGDTKVSASGLVNISGQQDRFVARTTLIRGNNSGDTLIFKSFFGEELLLLNRGGTLDFKGKTEFFDNIVVQSLFLNIDGDAIFGGLATFNNNIVSSKDQISGGIIRNIRNFLNVAIIKFDAESVFGGNSVIACSHWQIYGGVFYNLDGDMVFTGDAMFSRNSAESEGVVGGGVLYNGSNWKNGARVEIKGMSDFTSNTIKSTENSAYGGVLYNSDGDVIFIGDAMFSGNSATGKKSTYGGVFHCNWSSEPDGTRIEFRGGADFINNTATSTGSYACGGVFSSLGGEVIFSEYATFNGNRAEGKEDGLGGVFSIQANKPKGARIEFRCGAYFTNNIAISMEDCAYGGVFHNFNGEVIFAEYAIFIGNRVDGKAFVSGGAFYNRSNKLDGARVVFEKGSEFINNTAKSVNYGFCGGAIHNEGVKNEPNSKTAFYAEIVFNGSSLFFNNSAITEGAFLVRVLGGAIYNEYGSITFNISEFDDYVKFENNKTSFNGSELSNDIYNAWGIIRINSFYNGRFILDGGIVGDAEGHSGEILFSGYGSLVLGIGSIVGQGSLRFIEDLPEPQSSSSYVSSYSPSFSSYSSSFSSYSSSSYSYYYSSHLPSPLTLPPNSSVSFPKLVFTINQFDILPNGTDRVSRGGRGGFIDVLEMEGDVELVVEIDSLLSLPSSSFPSFFSFLSSTHSDATKFEYKYLYAKNIEKFRPKLISREIEIDGYPCEVFFKKQINGTLDLSIIEVARLPKRKNETSKDGNKIKNKEGKNNFESGGPHKANGNTKTIGGAKEKKPSSLETPFGHVFDWKPDSEESGCDYISVSEGYNRWGEDEHVRVSDIMSVGSSEKWGSIKIEVDSGRETLPNFRFNFLKVDTDDNIDPGLGYGENTW
jgi:hypothetical protein